MNHKVLNVAYVICLLSITFSLTGCSLDQTNYRRSYSGDPLSRNEVAIVMKTIDCYITALEEEGKPPKQTPLLYGDLELLPGKYTLYVHWGNTSTGYSTTTVTKSTKPVPLQFVAYPGRVYVIYPDFPEPGKWRPVIIDNVTNKDFELIANKQLNYPVWNHVEKILKGERRSIMQTEKGYWE